MTTSGTITGALTAGDFVRLAMEDLGLLSSGEMPAEEGATGLERLNWMLKSWQAKGCNLWRDTEATATFGVGVATVTLTPSPIDVIDARVSVSAAYQRSLTRWELAEYRAIPNKIAPGVPVAFTPIKGRDETTLTVWPVPAVSTQIIYSYARTIENVTALTQTLDVPQEWTETVWMCLAMRLANTFGATRADAQAVQRVTQMAALLEQSLLDHDRPASIFMGPVGRIRG
jgi:hypothetical protein